MKLSSDLKPSIHPLRIRIRNSLAILPLAGMLLLTSCNKAPEQAAATPDSSPVTSITITGNDRMRFNPTAFTVKANTEITLKLHNEGKMPKESMGHNLVIIDLEVAPLRFSAASAGHPRNEYISPEYEKNVIAATKVLGPGETEVLRFTSPSVPGDYPFVCSFPGHTSAGMKGIMKVVP